MSKLRDELRLVTSHAQAALFCGNGSSELLLYLPAFATMEDREEFGRMLRTLGESIERPFVQSSHAATPISLRIQADDEHTLQSLASAKGVLSVGSASVGSAPAPKANVSSMTIADKTGS